jgi:hypothetical protein
MSIQLFNKSYSKWKNQNDRDLIFKLYLGHVNTIPEIKQSIVSQKSVKTNDVLNLISLNILLFDEYPKILKINNTIDNKKKNTILGTKLKLSVLKFYFFFLRLKNEENNTNLSNALKIKNKEANSLTFIFNLNLFDEFLFLYDKYPTLNDVSVTLNFVNCKKMEEKQLLLKNLLLI